jgi:hypothetical protein
MPVPRLFEVSPDPREAWIHVVATILSAGSAPTTAALVEDLVGEALPDAGEASVREFRPLKDTGVVADATLRAPDGAWTVGLLGSLSFDVDHSDAVKALYDALASTAERCMIVVITPDRRTPDPIGTLADGGMQVVHRSWQRVRDWIEERPERGAAEGTDLMLLREADYYLKGRVADLYRLEEAAMPAVPAELRDTLAAAYFELSALAPSPRIESSPEEVAICFPRTGDPAMVVALREGKMHVRLHGGQGAPGFVTEGDTATLVAGTDLEYLAARSWIKGQARDLLPPRR